MGKVVPSNKTFKDPTLQLSMLVATGALLFISNINNPY